jgi:hypothetical protein
VFGTIDFALAAQAPAPAPAAAPKPADFDILPSRVHMRPKEKRDFKAGKDEGTNCVWDSTPGPDELHLTMNPTKGTASHTLTLTAPDTIGGVAYTGTFTLTCTAGAVMKKATVILTSAEAGPDEAADITTAVIGFEQAGGSSAESDRNFFFDFFISRPVPGLNWSKSEAYGPGLRWWGDVRIASYPQQINPPVVDFIQNFAQFAGNVKINEIAKFGEFKTGIDVRFLAAPNPFPYSGGEQKSSLGFIVYYGALGAFHPPTGSAVVAASTTSTLVTVPVVAIPAGAYSPNDPNRTPQAIAFSQRYPADKYPSLALPAAKYAAFTLPDRDQFYREYGAGLRLTTRFYDENHNLLPAPAMVSATVGQNELVSGGKLRGAVGTFEGFYPYRIRTPALTVYLFGRANLKFGRPTERQPLALQQAVDSANNLISINNPAVAIIGEPSRRDLYTIGFGFDLSSILDKWLNHGQ